MKRIKKFLAVLIFISTIFSFVSQAEEITNDYSKSVVNLSYSDSDKFIKGFTTAFYIGDGLFVTVAHGFDAFGYQSTLYIEVPYKDIYSEVELIYVHGKYDFALVKSHNKELNDSLVPLKIKSNSCLKNGDKVTTAGFPRGLGFKVQEQKFVGYDNTTVMSSGDTALRTVTHGLVMDAVAISGQSGSPYIDSNGYVVGILSAGDDKYTWAENICNFESMFDSIKNLEHRKEGPGIESISKVVN